MKRLPADNWIALAIVTVAIITAIAVVYVPQHNRLEELRAAATSMRISLESDAQKAAVVPAMVRQIEQMKKRYKGFDRRMPKSKELGGFLQEISRVLASKKLARQNTELGDPKRERSYHTLPIVMKFQGHYLSLASLLSQMDKMERLTRIQKLLVTRDPKKKSEDLNIELQMNIYFTES